MHWLRLLLLLLLYSPTLMHFVVRAQNPVFLLIVAPEASACSSTCVYLPQWHPRRTCSTLMLQVYLHTHLCAWMYPLLEYTVIRCVLFVTHICLNGLGIQCKAIAFWASKLKPLTREDRDTVEFFFAEFVRLLWESPSLRVEISENRRKNCGGLAAHEIRRKITEEI